jgi:hypothetical protein
MSFPNYVKYSDLPGNWSYLKQGISSDQERKLKDMHLDFVEGTGKFNGNVIEGFGEKTMSRFHFYMMFTIIIGFFCYLITTKDTNINVINFFKSPICMIILVICIILYFQFQ